MLSETVIQAISKVKDIPVEKITTESTFEELDVDSLDAIEILFEIEEAYDISVPTDQLQGLSNVQDVIDGVQGLLDKASAGDAASAPDADDDAGTSRAAAGA